MQNSINFKKINIYLSTLNFALCFVGYQLATSLFLPISSDVEGISRTITVPYRAFALLISTLVIFLNFRLKIKQPLALKLFWIYWIMLVVRIFYDTNMRDDVYVNNTFQLWLYVFGVCITTMYSVIKSYKWIDLNKALKWIFIGVLITLILSLFNNDALLLSPDNMIGRTGGNLAINTIAFGHIGTTGVVLSLFVLSNMKLTGAKKILLIFFMILSLFIILKAGSRSPVIALFFVGFFWIFAQGKNIVSGLFITAAFIFFIVIFIDPILNFMGSISPIIELRLRDTIYLGDTSDRDLLFSEALHIFLNNPYFGKQFAIFGENGSFTNSHNIILDSLMGLGLLGGVLLTYILIRALQFAHTIIRKKDPHFWIVLILIQQIVVNMFSGSLYYEQLINILLVFIFMYYTSNYTQKKIVVVTN